MFLNHAHLGFRLYINMMYVSNMNSEMQGSSCDITVTFVWIQDEHLSGNTATLSSMYVCMYVCGTWTYRVAVPSLHQSVSLYHQIIVDGRFVKYINLYIATDNSRSNDHKYKRF
jgi:hypothetical protein